MRNHTCLFDHHQRSHCDTITIGPEGKFNWVLQLISTQKEKLFDSLEEKLPDEQNSSNQPIPKPICDRSGQLDITQDVIGVQTCPSEENKNVGVEQTHDRSVQLDKHYVAVQDDPEVYHEIKTLNTDNELMRERIEENMDFRIPGLPHSIVKQLQSASVRDLIQKIENHPNRHASQRNLQQSQSFQSLFMKLETLNYAK